MSLKTRLLIVVDVGINIVSFFSQMQESEE